MNYCKSFVCNFDVRSFFVVESFFWGLKKSTPFANRKLQGETRTWLQVVCFQFKTWRHCSYLTLLYVFSSCSTYLLYHASTRADVWVYPRECCTCCIFHIPNIVRFEVASFHSIERNHNLFDISILHWGIHWILHLPFKAIISKSCLWWFRSLNGWHFGFQLKVRILRFESSENTMKHIKKPKTRHTSISLS